MPRPKRAPADGLAYPGKTSLRRATRKGGEDSTLVGEHLQRKTYVLDRDQVERIKKLAEAQGVGINELVRWLLTHALGALDGGQWELPIEEVTVKRIAQE